MGRIIGLIGGTCVLIALVRLTNLQHEDHTLRAGTEAAQSQPQIAPRDAYRRGKEAYLRGKYEEALPLLEAAAKSATGLTEIDRRNAEEYLGRTRLKLAQLAAGIRAQSPDSDPFAIEPGPPAPKTSLIDRLRADAEAPAAAPVADATRTRVERLMTEARVALKKGNRQEAFRLAQQANQLAKTAGVKFAPQDQTPAAFLAQLQGGAPATTAKSPAELPEWANPAGGVKTAAATAAPANIELIGAETLAEPTTPASGPAGNKAQALALVKSARADLKAGHVEEARRKALQAQQMGAAYDLFDDRPELLLVEIDRRSGTNTVINSVADTSSNTAPKAAAPAKTDKPRTGVDFEFSAQDAPELLKLAREDLKNGNLAGAREKAEMAQQLNVAYKLFEDRPELVLNDIAAFQAASNIAQKSATKNAAGSLPAGKTEAKELLAQARTALTEGRIEDARKLAVEAEQLKAVYGVFDDRPEIVLADITRMVARGNGVNPAAPAPTTPDAMQPGSEIAAKTNDEDFTLTPQQKAAKLLQEARQLLEAGKYDEARRKAEVADQINIAYGVFSDRPETILQEIAQAKSQGAAPKPSSSNVLTADVQFPGTGNVAKSFPAVQARNESDGGPDFGAAPILAPGGLSAIEHYNHGLAELSRGNRDAALLAFQSAHQSGQRLDSVRTQRLQDYLRELSPRNASKVQQTSRQVTANDLSVTPYEEPNALDAAAQAESVKFDRLRTETLNAVFRAERLREKDPEQALEIVDRQMAAVEGAELGEQAALSLMRSLQKTHSSLQNEIMQQKPNLDQKRKNEEVLAALERDRNNKLRIEVEFAKLVDEYNAVYEQRRYAEAEVIAKKAKELDPKNPVTQTLFWKARMARRVDMNEELKLDKEDSFIRQLHEVDAASVVNVGDDPIDFGKDWKDISARRKGKHRSDTRMRSDEELRIEESLKRRISLHEDGSSLAEVMKKISTLVGINIVFDTLGLEDEGVTSNVPVAIDVDGITVKSALNLMLEPHRLGYLIEDEVLKITSRIRQQGEFTVATYSVADLVIPIPNFLPANGNPFQMQNPLTPSSFGGAGQMSVPAAGQPFAQVGPDPLSTPISSPGRAGGGAPTADFNTLTDLITSTIAPDSWDHVAGNASIRHYDTTLSLVIRQTQAVHEQIADLLDQLRRLQDLQVTIEVRFVTVSDRFFERIGIDFDFNIQDSVGGPDVDNNNIPLLPFGGVQIPQAGQTAAAAGQNNQQQGQNQNQAQGGTNFFSTNVPTRQLLNRDNYPKNTVVGMTAPETFSQDLDVPFRQGSFEVGVPTFGGFNPNAGVQMGLAVLSDIEAFFFIQAAQGDTRSNLLFAPKVTLFNGQFASVTSAVQRPFVVSVTPTVGFGAAGFQPQIQTVFDGVQLTVQAVISADRRFVRLTVIPQFQNLTDVFTFSFQGGAGAGVGQQGQGGQLGQQGQGGGLAGANNQGGGGGQFGIGGGLGTSQMLGASMFSQQNQGGQNNNNNNNNNNSNLTVTVQQPVVEQVIVSTTVSVPDGGTVLLGGVKRLREGRNMAGVPILNKIPYVSRLFKNTGVGRETESLMLMVTPRIIIQEEEEELLGIPTE